MKLSLWYNGHHVELEGTKYEIMEFLDNLKHPEITFTGGEPYIPQVTYWGGKDAPNVSYDNATGDMNDKI